jgi:hypothetical protein
MADLQRESQAFLAWLATFDLSRPVTSLSDLSDGAALFDVLSLMYVSLPYLTLIQSINIDAYDLVTPSISGTVDLLRNSPTIGSSDSALSSVYTVS